jgi:hypothetical protein
VGHPERASGDPFAIVAARGPARDAVPESTDRRIGAAARGYGMRPMDTLDDALRCSQPVPALVPSGRARVGLWNRTVRAAATALLVAVAVGAGGMASMTSALAADPGMVVVSGSLVDGQGLPLGGVHLTVAEEVPPDGGAAAFPTTTAADGSFSAEINAWGTVDALATLTITTPSDETIEILGESCSQTWGIAVLDVRQLAMADTPPDALTVTAATTLLGEVCGTTATPPPATSPPNAPRGGGGSQPDLTPPPTDTFGLASAVDGDRAGPALTIGFAIGLLAAGALLLPRPRTRRRD